MNLTGQIDLKIKEITHHIKANTKLDQISTSTPYLLITIASFENLDI